CIISNGESSSIFALAGFFPSVSNRFKSTIWQPPITFHKIDLPRPEKILQIFLNCRKAGICLLHLDCKSKNAKNSIRRRKDKV
ncbi:MAG: hypothetical protein IJ521_04100, partial [Schwartzia sp.]|nr:hypothetical protein [Schwartzia sp. (in: firmicutes)]